MESDIREIIRDRQLDPGPQQRECWLCKRVVECRSRKAAHVPMYAWTCDACAEEWCGE